MSENAVTSWGRETPQGAMAGLKAAPLESVHLCPRLDGLADVTSPLLIDI